MSATTRMILDSVRTIVIWIFSLAFQWQVFHYMQVCFREVKIISNIYIHITKTYCKIFRYSSLVL